MIITAIRWRAQANAEAQAFKLNPGTGKFRNYQCVSAEPHVLRQIMAALEYALTGTGAGMSEASVQLSDDGGHTWVVARKPGQTRFLKDGAALTPVEGERGLALALMDLDLLGGDGGGVEPISLKHHAIRNVDGELRLCARDAPGDQSQSFKEIVTRQITDVAADAARAVGITELAEPKVLAKLARRLEPLHGQYRELCRQYKELKQEGETVTESEHESAETLAAEIELLNQLAEAAEPMLAPGVSPKAYKEDLAKLEAQIAEICNALGIETPEPSRLARDFRKPIEALCRLEAHAKLIRASQGARKYCEQNIEPLYKKYLDLAEGGLVKDRQIAGELESCLATLSLKMRPGAFEGTANAANADSGLKTWFDRFKSREKDDTRDLASAAAEAAQSDIETARMAIEYALNRLGEIGGNLEQARQKHDGALQAIDSAHEELVKSYGRLREHWLVVAKEHQLPEDLDVTQLLRIIAHFGRLANVIDQRQELAQRLRKYTSLASKVERLVTEWRKLTGSQKSSDLSNPVLLLTEARDVLRYRDVKKKKFEQLTRGSNEAKAADALRTMLKARRKVLIQAWRGAFEELNLKVLEIHHEGLDELYQRANVVRALALVHGSAGKAGKERLFDADSSASGTALYLWDDPNTDNKLRLAFLSALESAEGAELRLLFIADDGLASMLGSLGIGQATRLVKAATPAARLGDALPVKGPTPSPVIARPTLGARPESRTQTPSSASLLNDRARRTLDLLSGKKG